MTKFVDRSKILQYASLVLQRNETAKLENFWEKQVFISKDINDSAVTALRMVKTMKNQLQFQILDLWTSTTGLGSREREYILEHPLFSVDKGKAFESKQFRELVDEVVE